MATMEYNEDSIITVITPINVGIVKFYDDPSDQMLPINDYITLTLDRKIICARTSVCARKEFEFDEFWLNGERCDGYIGDCLDEVKSKAIAQDTVTDEFLERKVHVCCENNFLPATGSAPFAAGIIALMTSLCSLYKIRSPVSADQCWFSSVSRAPCSGFVMRRDPRTHEPMRVARRLASGIDWPEFRVLMLVIKPPVLETSTTRWRPIIEPSYLLGVRQQFSIPKNIEKIRKAIMEKDFATFAEVAMKDTNQFHAILQDTYPPRNYKTEISNKIVEMIDIYNRMSRAIKIGYTFETGPNPCIYFEEKNAAEIISLVKYMFPSKHDIFIKGGDFPKNINPESFSSFPLSPEPKNAIQYAIYTKIGQQSVAFDEKNHLLDHKGNIINRGRTFSMRNYLN